jgi:PAS domain S-box-containing protein
VDKGFSKEIEAARQRAKLLNQLAARSPSQEEQGALQEALEELQTSLVELQVAEAELRQQNEELIATRGQLEAERLRYVDLFEFAPDGYLVTRVDGIILEANHAACEMLDVPQRFIERKPLVSYVAEGDRKKFRAALYELNQSNSMEPGEIEVRLQARNGEVIDVGITVGRVRDETGKPVTLRWLLRDISERKQAEEEIRKLNAELEQRVQKRTVELENANQLKGQLLASEQLARAESETANRSKDEFLATFSHELRTPLNAILGWVHILRSHVKDNEMGRHALEVIERNAIAQSQLINDILEVSRIVSGKLLLEKCPVALMSVIESALDSVRPGAQEKGFKIITKLDADTGLVNGDPARLQQVMLNLLSNAIKFTPEGGRIEVKLGRDGNKGLITVSDTGRGIAPDFLPYIFDRFVQGDRTPTRKYGGLGIGLAIVRHIVEAHGGTVQASSDGEDKGSSFTVSLPLMVKEAVVSKSGIETLADEFKEPMLEGITVLVVDDEQDAREMLKIVLEQWEAKVILAGSCKEAIACMEKESGSIGVLLADISMPEEDGFDLIAKVRKHEREVIKNIPAIALTAYASYEDRVRVLESGFQAHLPKPVPLAELGRAICEVVKKAETAR